MIADTIERVNRVYFFDLIGAAGGCAVLVRFAQLDRAVRTRSWWPRFYSRFRPPSGFISRVRPRGRIGGVLLGLLLVGLITYNWKYPSDRREVRQGTAL